MAAATATPLASLTTAFVQPVETVLHNFPSSALNGAAPTGSLFLDSVMLRSKSATDHRISHAM
jgi:hypothetical protein